VFSYIVIAKANLFIINNDYIDTQSYSTIIKVVNFYPFFKGPYILAYYLTLRSVFPVNNPQNSEMKICEKYEVDMLKIIIIYHRLHSE
jgi:hypothetical protein